MKIAYIVLCHKNVQQINKLLDLLYDEESAFFIHIDKKAKLQKSIHVKPNIHILPNDKRIDIKWGNISMIEATRNLIEAVFDDDKKYDYIWLMSGQDFPLRSKEDIKEYLEGPSAISFSTDELAPVRVLSDFAKKHEALQLKVGIVEGKVATEDKLKEYASIPSREGLLTMLAGGLMATVRDLSICLDLYAKEKEEN